ncbi:hypothetical protein F751_6373 [Auxenochlorella protothecoides]|uniref:Uncharacterized protein n=1 Tax=Auxenochlorella protothecoides TaxID=3075 RepID=A0A087SSB0_AUXPR|nr:hypothetical protein F751_6373 [Auxenochlorella protothecoides]KFM28614.1 hypothetical protein F751_6373 [Auxenochlorella protothecoides]
MPPVQLVSVNELAGDENENCQARWSAAVNEWRTELGEAGTTGRYGKVVDDYATTSVKTTWNGFRGLPKKTKKTMQQQERVCNALRPTVDNIVAVITESRTIGDLFANFHAIRMVEERLLAERDGRQPAAPAPAQAPESAPPGQVGEEAMQPDANRPDGFEAVHITGTLTTLGALLRRHEKFDRGGVARMIGLQLPTEKEWRIYTEVEVLKLLNLETVCATVGSKLTAKKRRAVEACLRCKLEEFEVDVDRNGQQKKGRKAVRTGKTGEKKTDWFVHIGWAFFTLLFNFRRFEGCGWYSAGHWRTNGVTVTLYPLVRQCPAEYQPQPSKRRKLNRRVKKAHPMWTNQSVFFSPVFPVLTAFLPFFCCPFLSTSTSNSSSLQRRQR